MAQTKQKKALRLKRKPMKNSTMKNLGKGHIKTSTIWRFVIVLVSAIIQEETLIASMTLRQAALSQRVYMRVGRQAEVRR